MSLEELELYFGADVAKEVQLYSFIISSIIIIAMFILKAVAIKTLAKNKGLDKLYLAWIPFFNYILLGKVIGTSYLFRKKVNNIGLLVTIATLTSFTIKTLLELGYYVNTLGDYFGFTISYDNAFISNWMGQKGAFFTVIWYLYDIIAIIEIILTATIIFFIFRKYEPERAFIYSIISIFIEFMFGPLLFLIRNKKASPYDDFMRRRVVVIQNPYDNNNVNNGKNNAENDPFPEFSNEKTNLNGEANNIDDFFN